MLSWELKRLWLRILLHLRKSHRLGLLLGYLNSVSYIPFKAIVLGLFFLVDTMSHKV